MAQSRTASLRVVTTRNTLSAVLIVGMSALLTAATWRVDRLGAGDFTSIQDAIDQAAPGDTISIAAGRYDNFHLFTHPDGETAHQTVASIGIAPLTFIGDSRDDVRFGPASFVSSGDGQSTRCFSIAAMSESIRFEQLTLENTFQCVSAFAPVEMEDCRIRNPESSFRGGGVELFGTDGSRFVSCLFNNIPSSIGITSRLAAQPPKNLVVESSTFRGCRRAIEVTGVENMLVRDCKFERNAVGIQLLGGGTAEILGSTFSSFAAATLHVSAWDGAIVTMRNNRLNAPVGVAIQLDGTQSHLIGNNNWIDGGGLATLTVFNSARVTLNGCTILNGGRDTVEVNSLKADAGVDSMDLTGNYWGTTDTEILDNWITGEQSSRCATQCLFIMYVADSSIVAQLRLDNH